MRARGKEKRKTAGGSTGPLGAQSQALGGSKGRCGDVVASGLLGWALPPGWACVMYVPALPSLLALPCLLTTGNLYCIPLFARTAAGHGRLAGTALNSCGTHCTATGWVAARLFT